MNTDNFLNLTKSLSDNTVIYTTMSYKISLGYLREIVESKTDYFGILDNIQSMYSLIKEMVERHGGIDKFFKQTMLEKATFYISGSGNTDITNLSDIEVYNLSEIYKNISSSRVEKIMKIIPQNDYVFTESSVPLRPLWKYKNTPLYRSFIDIKNILVDGDIVYAEVSIDVKPNTKEVEIYSTFDKLIGIIEISE